MRGVLVVAVGSLRLYSLGREILGIVKILAFLLVRVRRLVRGRRGRLGVCLTRRNDGGFGTGSATR